MTFPLVSRMIRSDFYGDGGFGEVSLE